MPETFIVSHDFNDSRFDKWFKLNVLDIPQSLIQKIIRQNKSNFPVLGQGVAINKNMYNS